MIATGYGFLFGGDENVLTLILVMAELYEYIQKAIELYTVNWWIK